MITHSETIGSLMKAMHAVQGAVDGVAKDAKNPHFKSRYASLEAVVDTIRKPCQAAGLVVVQAPGAIEDGTISITTMIAHAESGEWIRSTMQVPLSKNDPQGAGSAITYGERYSLMALFNLPPVDDDGEAAVHRPTQSEPATLRQQGAVTGQFVSHAAPPNPARVKNMREAIDVAVLSELDALEADQKFRRAYDSLNANDKSVIDQAIANRRRALARPTVENILAAG